MSERGDALGCLLVRLDLHVIPYSAESNNLGRKREAFSNSSRIRLRLSYATGLELLSIIQIGRAVRKNKAAMSAQLPESRVLIIMTGGTICMRPSSNGLTPATGFLEHGMAPRPSFNDGSNPGRCHISPVLYYLDSSHIDAKNKKTSF